MWNHAFQCGALCTDVKAMLLHVWDTCVYVKRLPLKVSRSIVAFGLNEYHARMRMIGFPLTLHLFSWTHNWACLGNKKWVARSCHLCVFVNCFLTCPKTIVELGRVGILA